MPTEFDPQVAASFGRNLRAARKKAGIGQEKLAWAAGIHRTAVGMLESGRRVPRLTTVLQLAKELDVEPAELLKGVEPSPVPKSGPPLR
jgi:transcriptional regulator with XRE-family HTH domain